MPRSCSDSSPVSWNSSSVGAAVDLDLRARAADARAIRCRRSRFLALVPEQRLVLLLRDAEIREHGEVELAAALTRVVDESREPVFGRGHEAVVAHELALAVAPHGVAAADRQLVHREQRIVGELQQAADEDAAVAPLDASRELKLSEEQREVAIGRNGVVGRVQHVDADVGTCPARRTGVRPARSRPFGAEQSALATALPSMSPGENENGASSSVLSLRLCSKPTNPRRTRVAVVGERPARGHAPRLDPARDVDRVERLLDDVGVLLRGAMSSAVPPGVSGTW